MEVNCIKLENGKDYIVIDVIVKSEGRYLVLVQEDNEYDIQIRKVITQDDKEYLSKLDTEEEYDNIIKEFYIRHNRKGE